VKWLIASLIVLLLVLQYRLWFGDGSLQQFMALRKESKQTHTELLKLRSRNQALEAEVTDLKNGLDAIEERARTELGMIDENETFYQFVRQRGADAAGNADEPDDDDDSGPIDADGSAAGAPETPEGDQLPAPGQVVQGDN